MWKAGGGNFEFLILDFELGEGRGDPTSSRMRGTSKGARNGRGACNGRER